MLASDIEKILQSQSKTEGLISGDCFEEAVEVASVSIRSLLNLLQETQKSLISSFHQRMRANIGLKKFYRAQTDSESIDYMSKEVDQEAEGHYLKALVFEGMHNINAAFESLRKAIKLNNHSMAKKKLAEMNANPFLHLRPKSGHLSDELWVHVFKMLDLKTRIRIEQDSSERLDPKDASTVEASWKLLALFFGPRLSYNITRSEHYNIKELEASKNFQLQIQVSSNWQTLSLMSWNDVRNLPNRALIDTSSKQIKDILPAFFVGLLIRCGRWCSDIDLSCVDVSRVRLEGVGRFRQRNKLRWLLQTMSIYCPNLKALTIPDAAFVDEDLEFIFTRFPRLTAMKLVPIVQTPEGRLSGRSLGQLPEHMKFLSVQMAPSSPPMDDITLFQLADRCPDLELLEFFSKGDTFFSPTAVEYLTRHCKKLKKLKLGCVGEGSSSLECHALLPISNMNQLRELCLWVPALDDQFAAALVSGCNELRCLELHADTASASALSRLASFNNIKDLRLDLTPGLPWSQFLHEFSKEGGAILEILALSKMSPSNFNQALKQFPRLGEICLWNSYSIDSGSLVDVLLQNSERTNKVKITASCYYVQLTPELMQVLNAFPLYTLACYFDHTPCDLCNDDIYCNNQE